MESFSHKSIFQHIRSRELDGFRVRKRPYVSDDDPKFDQIGAVDVEHDDETTPPMALSFCKTDKNSHLLAVTDEAGFVSLFNTRLILPSSSAIQNSTERTRISEWVAHENAVFDICWIKDDANILTASGDQSIKLWDAEEKKCVRILAGHTGSVKTICAHPTSHDKFVSGSRDGSFALWDLRCAKNTNRRFLPPVAAVYQAHVSPSQGRVRRGKASSKSITSVLYLKDEISVATAGAVDSIVKFWDTRKLKDPVFRTCPFPDLPSPKEQRLHGISSLSQDKSGVLISASCMDSRIYLYNLLKLESGPIQTFYGCHIDSFFVKSALSPDAAHLLSGSSDGNAYIWQVNQPDEDPVVLNGHDGEVTAVDWSPSEIGKIATASDDFTVRLWNIKSSCYSSKRSPSSIRKRVTALRCHRRRKLLMDEPAAHTKTDSPDNPENKCNVNISSDPTTISGLCTPKSHNKLPSSLGMEEELDKTPESIITSPSSVLNPPSSLKRKTILDYFLAAS